MTDRSTPPAHAPASSSEPGPPSAAGCRFAVIAARFNGSVVERLAGGALECLSAHGAAAADVEATWVPGAFELPLAALAAARTGRFDAVLCLGAVIRGETAHFDLVAGEAARGIQQAALDTGVPVLFGVLTTDTVEQAMARAGGDRGNKGWECAIAAMEMVAALHEVRAGARRDGALERE